MKSTLHLFGNTCSLQCRSPIIADTDLLGVDFGGVFERLCKRLAKPFSSKVLVTNLLMSSTFPPAYPYPELIKKCIHMYNVSKGTILRKDIIFLLNFSRETVSSLFHLEEQQFANLTTALSTTTFV